MDAEDRQTLTCSVCGRTVRESEPLAHSDDGVAHLRCIGEDDDVAGDRSRVAA